MKPLAIDLFCGLGGWSESLLDEGYDVIGFDIERHVYGEHRYPAQLVIQDVLTLHGSQFREAALIVASPPCQRYSYMAMPWSRAKKLRCWYSDPEYPDRLVGLNALFNACFRIQREASEAAGRHIPLIVENVRGAQDWVGRSRWAFGSFHLWGDVPALMPPVRSIKNAGGSWFAVGSPGQKVTNQNPVTELAGRKGIPHRTSGHWANPTEYGLRGELVEGRKGIGGKSSIRNPANDPRPSHGDSASRKFASAMIAKIPEPLAQHIAVTYHPRNQV